MNTSAAHHLTDKLRNVRSFDSHNPTNWRHRRISIRDYDLAQRKPQTHRSLHGAPRKGLAVILGLIVVGAVVLWRVW